MAVYYLGTYEAPAQLSEHEAIAARLIQGEGYSLRPFHGVGYLQPTSWMAPAYPFLLAGVYALLGVHAPSSFLAMQALQGLASAFTCLLLYRLGTRVLGRSVGLLAGFALAFYPPLVYAVTTIRPLTFIILLLTAVVELFYRVGAEIDAGMRRAVPEGADWGPVLEPTIERLRRVQSKPKGSYRESRQRRGVQVTCGLVVGLLALLEPVTLGFTPFAAGWLLFRRGSPLGLKLRTIIVVAAMALLVISPWAVRNYLVHRRFVLIKSSLGYQLWVGNNPNASGTARAIPDDVQKREEARERQGLDWRALQQLLRVQKQESTAVFHTMSPEMKARLEEVPEAEADSFLMQVAVQYIREQPDRFLVLSLRRAVYFWWLEPTNPLASTLVYVLPWAVILPFGILGVITSLKRWRCVSLLLLLLFSISLPYLLTVVESRFRMPLEPYVILFAAQGLVWLRGRVTVLRTARRVP